MIYRGEGSERRGADADDDTPSFVDPFHNVTVMEGRDAILSCTVKHLGDYKVAWVKVETQTILSVGINRITRDTRFKVTQSNQQNWYLHVSRVTYDDKGNYMCQVNTKPMRHRNLYLHVLVPPKVIESETSSGVTVKEFKSVSLRCRASGHPRPTITWQREDNKVIMADQPHHRDINHIHNKPPKWMEGEFLNITRVTRNHMGAYLCIATNQVPPSVSKRIVLEVTFAPRIKVPHQLVGSPIGSTVHLTCQVEGYPVPMTSWQKYDKLIVSDDRYQSVTVRRRPEQYTTVMTLTIVSLDDADYGAYKCTATNVLGTKEGLIRLYRTETFSNDRREQKAELHMSSNHQGHVMLNNKRKHRRQKFDTGQGETILSVYSAKVIELNSTNRDTERSEASKSSGFCCCLQVHLISVLLIPTIASLLLQKYHLSETDHSGA